MPDHDSDRSRSSSSSPAGGGGESAPRSPAPGDAGGNAARVSAPGGSPAPAPASPGAAPAAGPGGGGGDSAPAPPTREEQIATAIRERNAAQLGTLVTDAAEVGPLAERLARESDELLTQLATGGQANTWRRPAIAAHVRQGLALYSLTRTPEGKRDAIDESIAQGKAPQLIGSASIDSPDWAAALDDTKYQQLLNMLTLPVIGQTLFDVIWRLYGDGVARSADCARLTWRALYTARILPTGSLEAWSKGNPATSSNNGSSFVHRWIYEAVAPADDTMKRLLVGVKPLPQGHVNAANIAFSAQGKGYWMRTNPNPTGWTADSGAPVPNATSYYLDDSNSIVIVASGGGGGGTAGAMTNDTAVGRTFDQTATAVGGSAEAGAPALTYFLNHARHEIGHAVGHRAFQGVAQTGDDFARQYGGWAASSRGAFEGAMWSASGNAVIDFSSTGGANNMSVDANVVKAWLMGLLVDKAQPPGNAITNVPGGLQAKFDIIRLHGSFASQKLVSYCTGVFYTTGFDASKFQDQGYTFPRHDPPDPVHFWCDREDPKGFWTYSKAAYTALRSSHGWYSLSSHREMFAEMYTHKYSGGSLPGAVNGKDPAEYFRQLEASRDTALIPEGSATPPPPGGGGGATPGPAGATTGGATTGGAGASGGPGAAVQPSSPTTTATGGTGRPLV